MGKTFSRLVIDGHFILVKGFLMGFWSTQHTPPQYFFHRNTGIHHETFKDIVSEFLDLEDEVALCLEDAAVPAFRQAVEKVRPQIGIALTSVDKIKTGEFNFSYHVYSPEIGEACKTLFQNPPAGVDLIAFDPKETIRDEGKSDPHLHAYEYEAEGTAKGDFGGVMHLYLACKKSKARDFITTGEIKLNLET